MDEKLDINIAQFPPKVLAAGQTLFLENDVGGSLYIIRSGQVEVFRQRSGRDIVLATLGAGEILGAMTLTTGGPRTASARCKTEVSVVHLPREVSRNLVATLPGWTKVIIGDLIHRVEQADSLYIQSTLLPEGQRFFSPLLQLAVQVADGFYPLAELMVGERSAGHLPFSKTVNMLARVLNRKDAEIHKIFDIFESTTVLGRLAADEGKRAYDISSIRNLAFFSGFVREFDAANLLDEILGSMTNKMFDLLTFIVNFAQQKKVPEQSDDVVRVLYSELSTVLKDAGMGIDSQMMRTFEYYRMMVYEKAQDGVFISLNPDTVMKKLRCLKAIRQIDEHEDPRFKLLKKRILVY